MKKADSGQRVKIQGLVNAVGWDEDGNTESLAIRTWDEEEYVVELDDMGEELLDLENEEVRVSGIVREKEEGIKVISVEEYEVIMPEPYDDEYEVADDES